jgi:fluoroquinolone resistance protein
VPAKPDVIDSELEPWLAEPLGGSFEIEDARVEGDLANVRAAGGRIARSRLERTALTGSRLRSLALVDVVANGIEASAGDWTGGRLNRVVFDGCRMSGLILGQLEADDVIFRGCQLKLANFGYAKLRHVVFEDCVLDEADFGGATLRDVRFAGCQLLRADFSRAALTRVDLRGSELEPVGDVGGLRGAIIDQVQLAGLAPLLARAAGILVDDD